MCETPGFSTAVDAFPSIEFRSYIDFPSEDELKKWSNIAVVVDEAAFAAIKGSGKLMRLCLDRTASPGESPVNENDEYREIKQYSAPRATVSNWDNLRVQVGSPDVLICVGGGTCIDAGKWVASRSGLNLVCLPSALSVDAFFTGWSGYRHEGCVKYDRTKSPDKIVVDLDVLAAAPQRVRAAGICDVLSIATGLADWKFAHEKGMVSAEHTFDKMAYSMAESILDAAYQCAESAGKGEHQGLRRLLDLLCLEVTLCNQIGHSRPEEGSEHYLCYCMEHMDQSGKAYSHAEFVGPGLLVMGTLQGIDVEPLRKAYHDAGLSYKEFPSNFVKEALLALPAYCKKHTSLAYSVAHELPLREIEALDVGALLDS